MKNTKQIKKIENRNKIVNATIELIKKEALSPLAIMFQEDMVAFNPDLKKDEPGVLTGKTFYAEDAVKVGFAKRIGTIAEALRELTITSELNHYKK